MTKGKTSPPSSSTNKTLYRASDWEREVPGSGTLPPWRSEVGRDYARVIHSACFRRLQGKTQVFPGHESDFFRNRLTHSLEVAQIARSIAEKLNYESADLKNQPIDVRLCSVAGLVHDIGHPPFGHNGERALDELMVAHGGFEGNAQSLRILARLERKIQKDETDGGDNRAGLNLTWRTLASVLKYDTLIPNRRADQKYKKPVKGYYREEKALVEQIKQAVTGDKKCRPEEFKTLECSIMDTADDIAYSTYDLEDSLKAGFLTPAGILSSSSALLERVAKQVSEKLERAFTEVDVIQTFSEIFDLTADQPTDATDLEKVIRAHNLSQNIADSAYFRTALTSQLVNEFVNSVSLNFDNDLPMLSTVDLTEPAKTKVEVLKTYTFEATIYSSKVKLAEYRGSDVVAGIFKALSGDKGELLMPDDVRALVSAADGAAKPRAICDFVAGMTDRYALEFYARLRSDSAQSMFKPI